MKHNTAFAILVWETKHSEVLLITLGNCACFGSSSYSPHRPSMLADARSLDFLFFPWKRRPDKDIRPPRL